MQSVVLFSRIKVGLNVTYTTHVSLTLGMSNMNEKCNLSKNNINIKNNIIKYLTKIILQNIVDNQYQYVCENMSIKQSISNINIVFYFLLVTKVLVMIIR